MSSTDPPIRHAPRELWLIAQAFLTALYNLFGAPEDVARRHTLTVKAHQMLASWLRAGEALLPEEWRVSFRAFCMESGRVAGEDAGGPGKSYPTRFRSAWPLAERYEALLRAFNDPAPVAQRLARHLYVNPQTAARLLDEPPDYANRVGEAETLRAAAETASARFNTS